MAIGVEGGRELAPAIEAGGEFPVRSGAGVEQLLGGFVVDVITQQGRQEQVRKLGKAVVAGAAVINGVTDA